MNYLPFFPNHKFFPEFILILWTILSISIFKFVGLTELSILFVLLSAFFVKHLLADFHFQTAEMAKNKGTFMHPQGLLHSFIQGVGSFIFLFLAIGFMNQFAMIPFMNVQDAIIISIAIMAIDFVVHYTIDYVKVNTSRNLTFSDEDYWINLGSDQFLHYVFYLIVSFYLVLTFTSQ